jgi:hypothetical protein
MEFDIDVNIQPSFIAVVKTPSRGFAGMKTATMKLNGMLVPEISWPDHPEVTVPVELKRKNTLELEVDGPQFGTMEVTVRGVSHKSRPIEACSRDGIWASPERSSASDELCLAMARRSSRTASPLAFLILATSR